MCSLSDTQTNRFFGTSWFKCDAHLAEEKTVVFLHMSNGEERNATDRKNSK